MDTGVFSFTTPNLGDEMQSYAVLGHLDRVTQFLDRDRLGYYRGPDTHVVMNSYFFLGNGLGWRWPRFDLLARPPQRTVHPLWHGFHASRPEVCRGRWREYLREQPPIGCRDTHSVERLEENGISAYFSGCLTLFLGQVFPRKNENRHGVYLVDLTDEAEQLIPTEIRQRATRLTTFPPTDALGDALGRWGILAELIEKLANAELVVTRRLHVALPCVGFGTPLVVMPNPAFPGIRDRMSGYGDIMPIIFTDDPSSRRPKIDWHNVPIGNITHDLVARHEQFSSELRKRGIFGAPLTMSSPLDRIGIDRVRIRNTLDRARFGAIAGVSRIGRARLRLGHRTFPIKIRQWTDRNVDLGLHTFPGLSRMELQVELTADDRAREWVPCGRLQDLVLEQ